MRYPALSCGSRLLVLASLLCSLGCGSVEEGSTAVQIDGRAVAYEVAGKGEATVVFENGHGSERIVWLEVFGEVSKLAKAFRYDRPGYGQSDSSSAPRTAEQIVSELRATLNALRLDPPYVLVGHSLGGMYMEYYAKTFPQEVAALVLVDSRPADFTARCSAEFDADRCLVPDELIDRMPPHEQAELRAISQVEMEVSTAQALQSMPVFVLSSGKSSAPGASDVHELWLETQEDLAAQAPNSLHIVVPDAGHFIQLQAPDVVIRTIGTAIDASSG